MALEKTGVRLATLPCPPSSWSYPRRLACTPRPPPSPTQLSVLLTLVGEALQGVPSRLPRGPASAMVLPRPILPPATREPHTRDAGLLGRALPTARDDPRLRRRPLPSACPEPLAPRLVEAVRRCLRRQRPHPIVRVSEPARRSSTSPRDPVLAPQLQGIVPGHLRQARGDAPPWRGPRRWRPHLALRVPHPGVAPLLDQPPQGAVIEALCHHAAHPRVSTGVAEAWDLRCDHPVVSPPWARERPGVDRLQGPNRWPIALATAPALLRVDGGAEARARPLPPLRLDGRDPPRSPLAVLLGDLGPSDPWGAVARPLPALPQVPEVRFQGRLVRVRAHRIDAVGGLWADLTPAVLEPRRREPPVEVATPIRRGAFGLRCSALPGGWPGVAAPSGPVPVACAGAVFLSTPSPCGRRSRPPRTLGGSDSREALGCPLVRGSASRLARAAALAPPFRRRPPSGSGCPRLWRMSRRPGARVPRLDLDRPGPSRASHGPDASLHAYPARQWTPADPRGSPPRAPSVSAAGAFTPSPSALRALTGRSHTCGRAVALALSVGPCVRFTAVVRLPPPSPVPHAGGVVGET
jgi:hypothetical protein